MKKTKITLHEDKPTAISSTAYNANLDTIGFNMTYISEKAPHLLKQIISLYEEARNVK